MQFVCTSILTVIISVIDCAQPLTVIPIKLQPFGCNQAVIGRIYLQCTCVLKNLSVFTHYFGLSERMGGSEMEIFCSLDSPQDSL